MVAVLFVAGAVMAACSSDDGDDGGGDAAAEDTESDSDGDDGDESAESEGAEAGGDPGFAVVALDNGERFEFSDVRCVLEPEFIGEGDEIEQLFSAIDFNADDEFDMDLAQYGDAGADLTDAATINIMTDSFEFVWSAGSSSFDIDGGGDLDLTLSGSSITGSGLFFAGDDLETEPVPGTVAINCIEL